MSADQKKIAADLEEKFHTASYRAKKSLNYGYNSVAQYRAVSAHREWLAYLRSVGAI